MHLSEQTLELPPDFGGDLGAVFATQGAATLSPVHDRPGEALAKLIEPFVQSLKPLAENPPASFSDETRAQLWDSYAAGEKRLGEERGENARFALLSPLTRRRSPSGRASSCRAMGHDAR